MKKQANKKENKKRPETAQKQTATPQRDNTRFIWVGILVLLLYLFSYNKLHAGNTEDTAQETTEAPDFDLSAWFDGEYQDKSETYLKTGSSIGKDLLPLKNQIDYTVLNKYNMEDYIKGNKDYLISEGGIYTYLGKNYTGDSVINENVRKLKVISDSLERKHIDLVVLFAPTKEYAMPELIPAKYLQYKKRKNDYEAYIAGFKRYGVKHLDLLPFIQKLMRTYKYPIYPQYGTHLSYFTECMVADTTIKFIEHLRGVEMPNISWTKIDYPSAPRVRDADAIGKARLKVMPRSIGLAYPAVAYQRTANTRPVKTLGIGDSYYRSFLYLGVSQVAFNNGEYWYYYSSVVPETPDKKEVWEYDLRSKLESNEVVLLYYASGNLFRLGDGFIDDAYEMYTDPAAYYARVKKDRPLKRKIKEIHENPELLNEAEHKVNELNIPLDSAIKLEAESTGL